MYLRKQCRCCINYAFIFSIFHFSVGNLPITHTHTQSQKKRNLYQKQYHHLNFKRNATQYILSADVCFTTFLESDQLQELVSYFPDKNLWNWGSFLPVWSDKVNLLSFLMASFWQMRKYKEDNALYTVTAKTCHFSIQFHLKKNEGDTYIAAKNKLHLINLNGTVQIFFIHTIVLTSGKES